MAKKDNLTRRTLSDLRNIQRQTVKFDAAIKDMYKKMKNGDITPQVSTHQTTTGIFNKLEYFTKRVSQETLRLERREKKRRK